MYALYLWLALARLRSFLRRDDTVHFIIETAVLGENKGRLSRPLFFPKTAHVPSKASCHPDKRGVS